MNWYKKILSSNNIKFPANIEEQINTIADYCVNYYFEKNNNVVSPMQLFFKNPYTNQEDSIPIIIFPYTENFKNTRGIFNPQHRSISIFPYHHNIKNVTYDNLFKYFIENISHELTHAVDPLFLIPDWWRNRGKKDYRLKIEEFNAYSKQMEITIKDNLNQNNFEEFKNWLKSSDLNLIPSYLDFYKDNFLKYWQDEKPFYIKKLKQILYNEFIGEKK